jgi:hypothetical protein
MFSVSYENPAYVKKKIKEYCIQKLLIHSFPLKKFVLKYVATKFIKGSVTL